MKLIKIVLLFIAINSISFAQNAQNYFPNSTGYRWFYEATPLDSLNNPLSGLSYYELDSFAVSGNYLGKDAELILTKSGPELGIMLLPYLDSIFVNFETTTASQYVELIKLIDPSILPDTSIAIFLQSLSDWYPIYQFSAQVNNEYQLYSKDTTLTIVSLSIPLRFEGNGVRLTDENISTIYGTLQTKKFLLSTIVSLLITIPPFPPVPIPIITRENYVWIAEDRWIVKEYTPSTPVNLSQLGFQSFYLPGIEKVLVDIPTTVENEEITPAGFVLEQNYPNPFNPSTRIRYSVPATKGGGNIGVKLIIYDVLGKEIAVLVNKEESAGIYEIEFSSRTAGRELSSGVYFYQLRIGSKMITKKMVMSK